MSQDGDYEEDDLLGYCTVQFGESPTFRGNMSLPSSRSKSKPNKKPAEVGNKLSRRNMPLSLLSASAGSLLVLIWP